MVVETTTELRLEAMCALPEIARDQMPADGDTQAFSVLVTDEAGREIYTATLNFVGHWVSEVK